MPNNIIDSIRLSGTTYQIQGSGGGTQTVELTQAQYDALVDKDPNTFYIITDAEAGDLTNYYTKSETSGATQISTALASKQDTLQSGTNIKTINNESILGSGNIDIQGGSTYTAGRGISIANDTISFSLPISAGTGTNSIVFGNATTAQTNGTNAFGGGKASSAHYVVSFGQNSFSYGEGTQAYKNNSQSFGNETESRNISEHSIGQFNVSNSATTTFGNGGNTLFSVGNGTSNSARHNAFEIRQNGDIYLTKDGQDVKLQDQLGGGGSSYTAGDGIDITNDVISVTGKVDTTTDQTISGKKVFTYSSTSGKAIEFKQTSDTAKVGFRILNTASTNNELATFEFRPDTYTDSSSVKHPLLYLGHYRNTATANAGVPQTMVGFRQYDQKGGAAYHYLMPLPAEAKTPFSLTTSYKNYFAPLGFKNGDTMITTDNTGVADFSNVLGGLKLKKLTQAQYDALATKDFNTLYVIVN